MKHFTYSCSYAYPYKDGWTLPYMTSCTVKTNQYGYALSWPFRLGTANETNYITSEVVVDPNINCQFTATSTDQPQTPPEVNYQPVTNDSTPWLGGITQPNYVIKVYNAGDLVNSIAEATADSQGHWAIELSLLADGSHDFVVKIYNGETEFYSQNVTIITPLDDVPPVINVVVWDTLAKSKKINMLQMNYSLTFHRFLYRIISA